MDLFEWLETTLRPQTCTSTALIYDDMASQSGESLPVIYQPFDGARVGHWRDRGAMLDFILATQGEGKMLLDLGPGDGWPSLIVAPLAGEVVGVDGSQRRVDVCTANARRLGIANARFLYAAPGSPLPFQDNTFDGVMAASSVEQTPDPRATLQELYRVLRPGGRLRFDYESLAGYRNGRERDAWLCQIDAQTSRLILFDRHIDQEWVRQYGLTFSLTRRRVIQALGGDDSPLSFSRVTPETLGQLCPSIVDAKVCTTVHPSGRTMASWLAEIGFREVQPTHSGSAFAGRLFEHMPEQCRPTGIEDIDALLRPIVEVVVQMPAPIHTDPMITAVK